MRKAIAIVLDDAQRQKLQELKRGRRVSVRLNSPAEGRTLAETLRQAGSSWH